MGLTIIPPGKKQEKKLSSYIKKGGEVAVIEGVLGTPVSEDRVRGAKDAIKKSRP
ncbi:hypothetical protein RCO48_39560 [Peribacillus frigoritolerans]|nr:hypothetical protein [Peribacillus frigoritolerans]